MESPDDVGSPARLLIAGASVRAAVMSAQATDFELFAADLFLDQELSSCRQTKRLGSRYEGLREFAQSIQPEYWLYTGALENHPDLVSAVAESSQLLGTPATTLKRIRDPRDLSSWLKRSGFAFPDIAWQAEPREDDDAWIIKSYQSAAGLGITRAHSKSVLKPQQYYQRLIRGVPVSAAYLVAGKTVTFLGSSRQLLVGPELSTSEFLYRGSIGPLPLAASERQRWEHLGQCLVDEYCLQGLIGIDAVATEDELFILEVNPRYTASMEILERALELPLIPAHISACLPDTGQGGVSDAWKASGERLWGKAVVYSPRKGRISPSFSNALAEMNRDTFQVADLPQIGSQILPHHPLLTVLVDGDSVEDVQQQLDKRSRLIGQMFR